MPPAPLLLVDDEPDVLDCTAPLLRSRDFRVITAGSCSEALQRLEAGTFAALICDLHLPTEADGLAVLRKARELAPLMPVLMLTGGGSIASAVAAMRAGATDYLCKPIDCDRLATQIRELVDSAAAAQSQATPPLAPDSSTNLSHSSTPALLPGVVLPPASTSAPPRPRGQREASPATRLSTSTSARGRSVSATGSLDSFHSTPPLPPPALPPRPTPPEFIGSDPRMRQLLDSLHRVAPTRSTVLILGESGTGKTMTARALHQLSTRADRPFVEIACGSLSETLLESELFGHVQGSFTGALHDRLGKFLLADGGTLFLDEIGNASPQLQVKLLRVLQDRAFEPVGGSQTHHVDVRLILATNCDLEADVRRGTFRSDLYYRINVITLVQPPLRERPSDIPLLARHHLARVAREQGREIRDFTPRALAALAAHRWPGNVRELVNAVERGVVMSAGEQVDLDDLPEGIRPATTGVERLGIPRLESAELDSRPGPAPSAVLRDALSAPERQLILDALTRHRWNRQETAQGLGINRTTLYKKMKRLGITDDCELLASHATS